MNIEFFSPVDCTITIDFGNHEMAISDFVHNITPCIFQEILLFPKIIPPFVSRKCCIMKEK